jgi:dTDP-4-dehydrorhamnose 3,5-epimerase
MIFSPAKLHGLYAIELEKRGDSRGYFARAWCAKEFSDHNLPAFVQTNMSMCAQKGTIRGLHWQADPFGEAKYMRCIRGAVFDVAVDVRRDSPTFGKWFGIELTAENRKAVFVPAGCAHGYQALTDDTEVIYSSSCVYTPHAERGIRWSDPAFEIEWPIREAVVSEKDSKWPDFRK